MVPSAAIDDLLESRNQSGKALIFGRRMTEKLESRRQNVPSTLDIALTSKYVPRGAKILALNARTAMRSTTAYGGSSNDLTPGFQVREQWTTFTDTESPEYQQAFVAEGVTDYHAPWVYNSRPSSPGDDRPSAKKVRSSNAKKAATSLRNVRWQWNRDGEDRGLIMEALRHVKQQPLLRVEESSDGIGRLENHVNSTMTPDTSPSSLRKYGVWVPYFLRELAAGIT